jgi:hypothetical protein
MKTTRFIQEKKTFSMVCRVEIDIQAEAEIIWTILTDAKGFPRWNSTVNGIDGNIREGERIQIHVPGTHRTFRPKVLDVVANKRMIWSNGLAMIFKGSRSFVLKPGEKGTTRFIMEEKFTGLFFAMAKGMFPEFKPIFETYASDLKRESERIAHEYLRESLRLVGEH